MDLIEELQESPGSPLQDPDLRLMKESPDLYSKQEGKYGINGSLNSRILKVDQGGLTRPMQRP